MRHWNELQPGGQGLASEFSVYFKTLSDSDKEVSLSSRNAPRGPPQISSAIQNENARCSKSNGKVLSYPRYSLDIAIVPEEGQDTHEEVRQQ